MGLRDKIQDAKTQQLVINNSIKQLIQMQKPEYKYENTSVYVVLRLRTSVTKSHLQAKVTSLGYTMQKHGHFGKCAIVKMKYVSNV